MDGTDIELIAEKLEHAIDLMRAEQRMAIHRLEEIEEQLKDHEARLRQASSGITEFKVIASLVSGSSGIMSVIAFLRSLWGA